VSRWGAGVEKGVDTSDGAFGAPAKSCEKTAKGEAHAQLDPLTGRPLGTSGDGVPEHGGTDTTGH